MYKPLIRPVSGVIGDSYANSTLAQLLANATITETNTTGTGFKAASLGKKGKKGFHAAAVVPLTPPTPVGVSLTVRTFGTYRR